MSEDIILRMSGIEISFPGVKALNSVDFTLRKGEVHSIMGENGAGKSTHIKCLTGVYHKDAGTIEFDGKEINPQTVQESMAMGISSVYQEVNLCPNLTVAENIFIGRQPKSILPFNLMRGKGSLTTGMFVDWKRMNELSRNALKKFDLNINVTRNLDSYSVAVQQMVAIARAVDISAKILIFDEPTSSLDKEETAMLFDVIRKLKEQGMAIIFITHFLDQVYEISDRITVLRNGDLVGEYLAKDLPKIDLVTKMIGKDFDEITNLSRITPKENCQVVIDANDVSVAASVEHIDLTLKESEVVGFAGLLGSGRTETAKALFGVDKINSGTVSVKGNVIRLGSPAVAIRNKIALCPEDRKKDGIVGEILRRGGIQVVRVG